MKRCCLSVSLIALTASWAMFAGERPPEANKVALNGHVFTLPSGFSIELVAGPPLVNRPISADFDEQGRLYVSDSSGSNEKVDVQLKKKPHRIVRLEDTKGDGKFDKAIVFADKMMFPEGTMWFDGSLYVAAVPSIWKLTDTDGDGVADQRLEWFNGKTMTGCANDLHGPYRGPDGWIYWCKGAFAPQTYESPGKAPFKTRAAHVFRARPDGTGVERVMTGGMDNPVDLVFNPAGERFFTTTFFQFPGNGQRDGLVHAVYGGIYGKDWDVIHDAAHKWTSPTVMPVLTQLGAAAPAGLHCYESAAFGKEYRGNLFAALFNMQKVTRHVLEPNGSTFKTRDSDFVVSNNKDFHPTDVIEDADGSLLVIDTGGWYKLCCPTSQLVKPDVLGAIYRVRKKGAVKIDDPRGLKIPWAAWVKANKGRTNFIPAGLWGDPRPAVRRRAIEELARFGVLVQPGSDALDAHLSAVWLATRIDSRPARALVRRLLYSEHATVRQAALHSISLWRDRDAVDPDLLWSLRRGSPHERRVAAEALGRIGDKQAVKPLLEAAGEGGDRFLEHSLTYALIEIADAEDTALGLQSVNPSTRRAALVALDQMKGGGLTAARVTGQLSGADARLRAAAWWIASRHPEWGAELSAALRARLAAKSTPAERDELVQQLAQLAKSPAIQQLLAERLADRDAAPEARKLVARAMGRAGLKDTPAIWLTALTQSLAAKNADLLAEAIATARAIRLPKQVPAPFLAALVQIGNDTQKASALRASALAALPGGLKQVEPALFDFLRARLKETEPPLNRLLAAETLAHANLSNAQLLLVAESLKKTGPMETSRLLDAFGQSTDDKVGRRLIEALSTSPGRSAVRPETLKPLLAKYGPDVLKLGGKLLASFDMDAEKQKARLEDMLVKMPAGDVRRGQAVFNGAKAVCATCHAIGYLGGKVGPDLTRIGGIRTERDLLESIVFPSASFVRGYEPMVVVTRDGKVVTGILRKDAPDEVVLASGAGGIEEWRIPRDEIEEMAPGRVSVMPAGLDQQLTMQELADVVAFLKACK
jgi:putative membrane-bound dehydrogenase-like protein